VGVAAAVVGAFAAIVGIIAIFFFATIGAIMGAVAGWIVGLVPIIGVLVKEGFMAFGVQNPNLVAIGAMLGFVAGFFKGSGNGGKCG
jgi:hypothetical protein